jgi:hypothetical protein
MSQALGVVGDDVHAENLAAPSVIGPSADGDLLVIGFADPERRLFGQARLTLNDQATVARALVAVFADDRVLVGIAADRVSKDDPAVISLSRPADEQWSLRFGGGDQGEGAFALELVGSGPAAPLAGQTSAGDLEVSVVGQTCRVSGVLTAAGQPVSVDAIGHVALLRGHAKRPHVLLRRDLGVWIPDGVSLAVLAERPRKARGHDGERVSAILVEVDPPHALALDDARLSTTYDEHGGLLRAGLELWPTPDADYARRAAGELACTTSLTTPASSSWGDARWDVAFLDWRMDGQSGIGPYSILRTQKPA